MGATIGGLCGFVTYWSGAAIAAVPDLFHMAQGSVPAEFVRPIYSVTAWEVALVLTGVLIGANVVRYRWRGPGILSYVALVALIVGYVAYSVTTSIPAVPPHARWLSYILLSAEVGGLSLIVIFSFYSLDAATRRLWSRLPEERPHDVKMLPKVAFIVPLFNEPPAMVEQTIAHLLCQDYPSESVLVLVADDSTDEAVRTRIRAFCEQVGAIHCTRPTRVGFKAGAINAAVKSLPPDVTLVGIVDADYWVEPNYLREIVGYFTDPDIGFVQTPQDYRNMGESFLTRQYKRAEAYFYQGVMPSRNEQNSIIFCGTMGILRRSALEDVGGFAEKQICEDAEISVRLAIGGWNSLYVNRTFGKGLMPAEFASYKKQFHRWAFGNVRILLTHWFRVLFARITWRQKFDFIFSNLHWFDGFFVLTIALVLLYLGLAPFAGRDVVTYHQREIALLALVPVFLFVDSVLRLFLVLRRTGPVRVRDALLVQGMWFAVKFTNMAAVLKCLVGRRSPFVRTPKSTGGRLTRFGAFARALRITKFETMMAVALLSTSALTLDRLYAGGLTPAHLMLSGWLALYSLFFLCAPVYAYLSYRTLVPMTHRGVPLPSGRRAPSMVAGPTGPAASGSR